MYDGYECTDYGKEDENQKHISECEEILKRNKELKDLIVYENIFEGNVNEQIYIAKIFQENMKIKENMMKKEKLS